MIHLDCYNRAKERVKYVGDVQKVDIQQLVFEKIKTYKHFATQSEGAELEYIRYLTQTLINFLIIKSELDCKVSRYFLEELVSGIIIKPLTEKIADPDFVNQLLLILLDEEKLPEPSEPPSERVVMLSDFGKARVHHSTSVRNIIQYSMIA